MPRSTAAISSGRRSAAAMMRCTEPTSCARWTLWTASNSAATSPSFSVRTASRTAASSACRNRASSSGASATAASSRPDPLVGARALVDLAGEHDRRRRRAADDRGERALDGEHLHVVVQRRREHDERPAVVARHDAQHERAVEVDDRPADLGAVLELQPAQRLRRAVEARQVGEHHDRPAAARRVDRPGDLLRRQREQRAGRPLRRTVGRGHAVARQRPRLHPDHRHRVAAEPGVVDDGHLGLGHLRPALQRLVVLVDRSRPSPCGCRTASCGPGWRSSEKMSPTVVKSTPSTTCGSTRTSRSIGSVVDRPARPALARRPVGQVVVVEQDVARRRQARAPSTAPRRWAP